MLKTIFHFDRIDELINTPIPGLPERSAPGFGISKRNMLFHMHSMRYAHECFTLPNRNSTVQVSDTTMLNSSNTADIQKI